MPSRYESVTQDAADAAGHLLPPSSASHRLWQLSRMQRGRGGRIFEIWFFFYEMLPRGRFACLRWSARWKAAKRGGPSAGGFSSPGLFHIQVLVESLIDGEDWTDAATRGDRSAG